MTDYLKHKTDFSDPEVASLVDELSFWSSRFGSLLFDRLAIRRGINILDIGCATGFPLFELAHVFGSSCSVTGIDIWPEGLERARFKLKKYELTNVAIIEADGASQPFPASEFDLITSNLGINNWAEPLAVLKECFRVGKSGARILLTTNVVGHYQEFYDVFRDTLLDLGKPECLEKLKEQMAHRGTRESHTGLLQQAGWGVDNFIESSFQMRLADGNALFNHSLVKIGFLDGWKSVVDPESQKEVFAEVEHRLNTIAERDGDLRMTVPMLFLEGEKEPAG